MLLIILLLLLLLLLLLIFHIRTVMFTILHPPIKWLITQVDPLASLSYLIFAYLAVGKVINWSKINRSDKSIIPRLPNELIVETLSRLPLKQVSQAQLVCKEWQALTQDHHFIQKHMARTPVLYHWRNNNVSSYQQQPAAQRPKASFRFMHGCDGVIILYNHTSKKHILWNPAIFRVLELPDPNPGVIELALLYVPAAGDYRAVSIYHKDKKSVGCEILTLKGPSMSWKWKNLEFPVPDHVPSPKKVVIIPTGREVHVVLVTTEDVRMIVTLDVEAESFAVNRPGDDVPTTALNWDGKLGFVNVVGKSLELIKLQDYKEHKWGAEKAIIPLPFVDKPGFEGSILPLFNKGGDIWFWLKKETQIISYNIETCKIEHVTKSEALCYECGLVYPYKQSLLSFEGMRSDKKDADLERFRP